MFISFICRMMVMQWVYIVAFSWEPGTRLFFFNEVDVRISGVGKSKHSLKSLLYNRYFWEFSLQDA